MFPRKIKVIIRMMIKLSPSQVISSSGPRITLNIKENVIISQRTTQNVQDNVMQPDENTKGLYYHPAIL
jgi:hypothetical protein